MSRMGLSRLLLNSLILSSLALLTPSKASAATAGSGACQQTFTVTGTGEVAVFESGGFCYVAFKNTGLVNSQAVFSWTRPSLVTSTDVLVVGGGGGGGSRHGGGGGAGGFVQADAYAISSASTIAIAVGAGGSASSSAVGTAGQGSYFKATTSATLGLIAVGGGAGSSGGGGSGGSGGGAGAGQTPGSVSTQSQSTFTGVTLSGINFGNQGAAGANDTNDVGDLNDYWAGGGGGGAVGAGARPTSSGSQVTTFSTGTSSTARGGNGGDGRSVSWISSTAASNLVVGQTFSGTVYFAGGGGGGIGVDGQSAGTGGLGGGANGTKTESSGNAGAAFTGGGGGGSGFDDINKAGSTEVVGNPPGGAGGSGVVILRFVAPDITAPTFTNTTSFSLVENSSTGTNAATITVNESATITINSGNDSALFTVVASDSTTARIRFLTSPNFEAPTDVGGNNVYDLSVRATDTAGNFANQSIAITITNVNEAPSITNSSSNPTASLTQAENITSVTTYAATDPDAGAVLRFSLSGTDAADFAIDSVTGVLAFATNPDFEAPLDSDTNSAYIVIVTVSDGTLTDTQTVTVTITNVNESSTVGAPTFSASTIKGVSVTISITSNVAGKARFFVNGKRIPSCLSRPTTGNYPNFTVTRSWKPPVTGRQSVSATFTPADNTFSAANSPTSTIQVVKRGWTR